MLILHQHVEPLLKKPEPTLTDQTKQQSNVPFEKVLDCLVVGLDFEMRICFMSLLALIKQRQEHKRSPNQFEAKIAEFDRALNKFKI